MDGRTAAATLGVDRDASKDELRRAFRARAKELHPDAGSGGSTSGFVALRRAFDLLMATAPETAPSSTLARPVGPTNLRATVDRFRGFEPTGVDTGRPAGTVDLTESRRRPRPHPTARPGLDRTAGGAGPRDARGRTFEDHLVAALARP